MRYCGALLKFSDGMQMTETGKILLINSWDLSSWKGNYNNKLIVAETGTKASTSIILYQYVSVVNSVAVEVLESHLPLA